MHKIVIITFFGGGLLSLLPSSVPVEVVDESVSSSVNSSVVLSSETNDSASFSLPLLAKALNNPIFGRGGII